MDLNGRFMTWGFRHDSVGWGGCCATAKPTPTPTFHKALIEGLHHLPIQKSRSIYTQSATIDVFTDFSVHVVFPKRPQRYDQCRYIGKHPAVVLVIRLSLLCVQSETGYGIWHMDLWDSMMYHHFSRGSSHHNVIFLNIYIYCIVTVCDGQISP